MRRSPVSSMSRTTEPLSTPTAPIEAGAPQGVQPLASTNTAGYSLERCIALTLKNYPKLHEARARLSHRRAQQVQSWTQPYSEFNVTGGLALVPEVHGTALYSPDSDLKYSSDLSNLAWTIGVDGVVPLWTFGKITNLWEASAAQVKVAEHAQ